MPLTTKILCWNLDFFCSRKFFTGKDRSKNDAPAPLLEDRIPKMARALDRLDALLKTIEAVDPQILVVLEVLGDWPSSSDDEERATPCRRLSSGAGPLGLGTLANFLHRRIPHPWQLVPPLRNATGSYSDGVGIFYRSDLFAFVGPNVWKKHGEGNAAWLESTQCDMDEVTELCSMEEALSEGWVEGAGAERRSFFGSRKLADLGLQPFHYENIQLPAALAGGLAESHLAPRSVFLRKQKDGKTLRSRFTTNMDRAPLLADFIHLDPARRRPREMPANRLRLLACHGPKPVGDNDSTPKEAMVKIGRLPEAQQDRRAAIVVLGDTNSNLNAPADRHYLPEFLRRKWTSCLRARAGELPYLPSLYVHRAFPITPVNYLRKFSVDNALLGPRETPSLSGNLLNLLDPPPQLRLQVMTTRLGAITSPDQLNTWANAGKIRGWPQPVGEAIWGTSDHLPLVVALTYPDR